MTARERLGRAQRQGPDMADVFPFWSDVERTHQVTIRLLLERDLGKFQGAFEVVFEVRTLEGYLQPNAHWPKKFVYKWPEIQGLSWEAFLYQKLHRIDWELTHSYEQRELLLFPAGM